MPLRHLTRSLAAAGTLLLAAPAFAQNADLSVALSLDGDFDTSTPPKATPNTAGFKLGSEETYTVTVTNTSTLIVTEFTLNATLDPALKSVSVTDCKPTGTGTSPPPFPCTWTGSPIAAGKDATITIAATYPAPDPLAPATATCPTGADAVTVTSSVTVSNPKQDTTALTDPTASNDTASVSSHLRPWADLEVVSVDGPANANQGQTITYSATVKNNGPCLAPNVRFTFGPDGTLSYVSSTTGCTSNGRCELGDLAKGDTKTVSADYSVTTWPKEVFKAAVSMTGDVVSRNVSTATNPVATDDPNSDNDSGSTSATVDLSSNPESRIVAMSFCEPRS